MTIRPRFAAISLAFLLLFTVTAPVAGQVNLIANSGFSPGTLCPGQWSGPCADGFTGTLNSDLAGLRVVSEEDNYILEMSLPRVATATPHVIAMWAGGPVSAQTYEVSVSARSTALTGRARLVAVAEQQSGGSFTSLASAQTDMPRSTSTWTRVGLRLAVPSGTDRIRVELQGDGSCATGNCGVITFDDLRVAPVGGGPFAAGPYENVCTEGEFLDVATLKCLPRVTEYGFSESEFTSALSGRPVHTVSTCTEASLRAALERAEAAGGGIVRIPACEIVLTRVLVVPGSTLLEGAGVGNSVLRAPASACDGRMLSVNKRRHVVLRDFSLEGQGCVPEPVSILYSDNVKVERVEFSRALRNGLIFSYSRRITLRYNVAHGTAINNGLSSKDCFLNSETNETQVTAALCESRILNNPSAGGTAAPGSVWTQNYAVYSNHLFNNPNDHGLALHGRLGEIAGNLIEDNLRGIKLPDARQVTVHHNRMRRNELWGMHIYSPIVDLPPTRFLITQNEFSLNGEFAVRLEGSREVFLADNVFDRNFDVYYRDNPWGFDFAQGSNILRISARQFANSFSVAPETFSCAAGQDASLRTSGVAPVVLEGSPCSTYVVNLPPIALQDTASTAPGKSVALTPLANDRDVDGDELRFAGLVSGPFNGSSFVEGSTLTYTPTASFSGTEVMRYRVEDTRGSFTIGEIRVKVIAANRSPVAGNDQATTFQDTAVRVAVLQNDTDPDGDAIALVRIVTVPRNGTAVIDGTTIVFTPNAGFLGTDSFVYEISDGRGGIATATVIVTVTAQPNRNPVAQNDTVSTSIGSPIIIDVLGNDTDPDGDNLLFARFVSAPAHGNVTFVEGRVRYEPFAGYLGSDSFSYEVADGAGGSSIASVFITVTSEPNTPPVAHDDVVDTTTEVKTVIAVLGNDTDPDGDPLFITHLVQSPRSGTAVVRSNTIIYTSWPDFVGTDSLAYAVSDGRGGESVAMVRISVAAPVNSDSPMPPLALERLETFPNPASGTLNVRFGVTHPSSARLIVYDLLGRAVLESPLGLRAAGDHTHTVDINALPGGVYLLTLEIDNHRSSRLIGVTR